MEDLEALKELSDELEETHQENEKQLIEEIGSLISMTSRIEADAVYRDQRHANL